MNKQKWTSKINATFQLHIIRSRNLLAPFVYVSRDTCHSCYKNTNGEEGGGTIHEILVRNMALCAPPARPYQIAPTLTPFPLIAAAFASVLLFSPKNSGACVLWTSQPIPPTRIARHRQAPPSLWAKHMCWGQSASEICAWAAVKSRFFLLKILRVRKSRGNESAKCSTPWRVPSVSINSDQFFLVSTPSLRYLS